MSIAAKRMSRIKASPSIVISAKAMEMARAGLDVIALSSGEPDFDTPDNIKIAAMRAIIEGKTKYPPITGVPEFREAICRKLERENDLRYAPDQVLVCNGGKQVIYNALNRDARPGRRGRHPRAVLGELPGHGAARGRDAGGGPDHGCERVPVDARAA